MAKKSVFLLTTDSKFYHNKLFSHWSDQLLTLNNWSKRKHDNLVIQRTHLWERRLSPLGVYP